MIDLRSDTLTKPTEAMIEAIIHAEVGDDGRTNATGKGEDPTVNKLESLAADIAGHEDALFCNSGTMANILAMLTHCNRGDHVAIDRYSHIYQSEKSIFKQEYFGLKASFYQTNDRGIPLSDSIENVATNDNVKLISLENSISYQGGTCISVQEMNDICDLGNKLDIPIHVDGARIFNVAAHYDLSVDEFTAQADSVQFCLSKGLGAPIGSVLCGSKAFISKARKTRKLIGGGMRQAGIVAAAGIIALTKDLRQPYIDNFHTRLLAEGISDNTAIQLNLKAVQTNIIIFDVSPSGYSAEGFSERLAKKGLLVRPLTDTKIRMIVYREINKAAILHTIEIINKICQEIE